MCSSLHLLRRAYCAQCIPSIPLCLASQDLAPLQEGQNHPIVRFAHLCHMISVDFFFFPLCTSSFLNLVQKSLYTTDPRLPTAKSLFFFPSMYINLFELGAEVACYNRSVITNNKVNVFKYHLQSSCSERTDDVFVLLNYFYFFHLWEPLVPVS